MASSHLKELENIVGAKNVLSSNEDLICYSYDASPEKRVLPEAVVLPDSTEQVAKIVEYAAKTGLKIISRGAGTNLSGGTVATQGGIIMQMTRMNRILEIDQVNLVATVEPGVITGDIHSAVEKLGLFYPPDPGSVTYCTIGGNVGEGAGGLRGRKYGTTGDYVMGIEAVMASGEPFYVGGKTVKNVTGYDLKRLLVGSEGTLAVFTKILLKLIPLPETKKTMLATYGDLQSAAATVPDIISSKIVPTTLEFLDRKTIGFVEGYVHVGLPQNVEAVLLIEVDGPKSAVEDDARKVVDICTRNKALEVKVAKTAEEAAGLTLARRSALSALSRARPTTILEDATVPPSKVADMVLEVQRIGKKYNLTVGTFGHAGDGNLHPTFLTDERDKDEMQRVEAAVKELFAAALNLGGTISGEHGIGSQKSRFLVDEIKPAGLKAMKAIKKAMDPQNILNPGKIFPEGD